MIGKQCSRMQGTEEGKSCQSLSLRKGHYWFQALDTTLPKSGDEASSQASVSMCPFARSIPKVFDTLSKVLADSTMLWPRSHGAAASETPLCC